MDYLSFFTGIGGFDIALDSVGMRCAGQSEIDPHCVSVLDYRFGVRQLGDIRNVTANSINLGSIDLAVGGYPCQGNSIAGNRLGLSDDRSGLWFEFRRAIMEFLPKWFVIENVPGLLSANGGRDFSTIIGGLAGWVPEVPEHGWQSAGFSTGSPGFYSLAWRVLDSQFFGVAQRRRRVFIIGHLTDPYAPAEVLLERNSLPWDYQTGYKEVQEISSFSPSGALLVSSPSGDEGTGRGAASIITPYPGETAYAISGVGSKFGSGRHNQDTFIVYHNKQSAGELREYGNISPAVTRTWGTGGNNVPFIIDSLDGHEPGDEYAVRKLTPVEVERLQGFPDDFTRWGMRGGKLVEMSDSARYKMLGNAVTVNVVRWIASRIVAYDAAFRL